MSEALAVADDMLRSFFERWQRLEEAKQEISADLKELFAEMKGVGFDTKAARAVFREENKLANEDAADKADRTEFEAMCDLYRASLKSPRAGRARESAKKSATTSKGESDAKSADAVCEDDLIDRRRPQSLVPTEAEHQPSPDDETHDAPTESAADEISEPIPPSAVSPPQPTAPEQAVPLPVSSGAQIQSSEAGVATGAEAGAAKAETMAGPASAPFTPLAFLLKDHAPANPRCEHPTGCRFAFSREKATCAKCTSWMAKRKAREEVDA